VVILCPMVLLALVARHPIHSSSATISMNRQTMNVEIVLRVFADDFPPGASPAAVEAYLERRFQLTDREGRLVPLRVDSVRLDGLVVVTALTASAPRGLSGFRIWHGVLAERFTDQVNLVQASCNGRSVSLLFTVADRAKPLP
jgi:uncharacterized protein DUF6702